MEDNWIPSTNSFVKFFNNKGGNPRNDFRGAGIISLQVLKYIIESDAKLINLGKEPVFQYFCPAVVIINMTVCYDYNTLLA